MLVLVQLRPVDQIENPFNVIDAVTLHQPHEDGRVSFDEGGHPEDGPALDRLAMRLGEAAGAPYLAYELVDKARSLDQVIPNADRETRVRLVRDLARAADYMWMWVL